jgi:hypothetical protein
MLKLGRRLNDYQVAPADIFYVAVFVLDSTKNSTPKIQQSKALCLR